nr:hypothetical protein [Tanacetum cinerariifolium]
MKMKKLNQNLNLKWKMKNMISNEGIQTFFFHRASLSIPSKKSTPYVIPYYQDHPKLPVIEVKGKGIATDEQVAQSLLELHQRKGKSTRDQYIFQQRDPVTEEASTGPLTKPKDDTSANIVCDTPSPPDAKRGIKAEMSNSEGDTKILNVSEEKGKDIYNTMALDKRTVELDEGQAGSNPEEPCKSNVETEVESMVIIPIHQASSTVPPFSTHVIDITQPKPVSPPNQELIFIATITTTKTTLPPPPSKQQSTIDSAISFSGLDSSFLLLCDYEITNPSIAEAIQADCDVKATNIILQALPLEIYEL